jgi:acyl carrier protein
MSDTITRTRWIIADHLGLPVDDIRPESRIRYDLGADSMDLMEIVMSIQEEFGVEFLDGPVDIVTVADAVALVDARSP